jgi:hypothetical protein
MRAVQLPRLRWYLKWLNPYDQSADDRKVDPIASGEIPNISAAMKQNVTYLLGWILSSYKK